MLAQRALGIIALGPARKDIRDRRHDHVSRTCTPDNWNTSGANHPNETYVAIMRGGGRGLSRKRDFSPYRVHSISAIV